MGKKALVLAGGGSRGSYQVGVWRALRELGWEFEIVTGTSVGALNGALAVQGDYETAVSMWEQISTADVLNVELSDKPLGFREFNEKLARFLGDMAKNGGADPRPLEELLRRCVDEERVRVSPVDFAVVTVEFPALTPCILDKASIPAGGLVDYLMASAACFPAMKMRQIGAAKYIDGGYYDNMPVELAIQRGAQEIVAVDLEAVGRRRMPKCDGVQLHHIHCWWDLGVFLLFDSEVAKRNIKLGYLDALKEFGKLEGNAYAFDCGETAANGRRLEQAFGLIALKTGLAVQKYSVAARDGGRKPRLARVVKREPQSRPAGESAIAAAGETAARVFGLSPLEPYTFAAMNEQISAMAGQLGTEELVRLAQATERAKTAKDLLELVKRVDRKFVAALCLDEIRKAYRGENLLLPLLAAILPEEMIAGLYLFALELSKGIFLE